MSALSALSAAPRAPGYVAQGGPTRFSPALVGILLIGMTIAAIAPFVFLPPLLGVGAVVLAFGSSWVLTTIADRQVGGHTGDVLGAAEVVAECVVLTMMASAFGS